MVIVVVVPACARGGSWSAAKARIRCDARLCHGGSRSAAIGDICSFLSPLSKLEDTLDDASSLRNLFHRNAVHVGENGRKCLKFENFARILLPLTFQLCERPSGGKTVVSEEELWKKFHGNAVVDEKSTIWADVQADILRMKDVSDEDDEKTRLLKIAANALEKFKIEEPVDVYKFGVSGDKKKGRNGK